MFEQHRQLLSGAAYRILGSRVDAEDVVLAVEDGLITAVHIIRNPEKLGAV